MKRRGRLLEGGVYLRKYGTHLFFYNCGSGLGCRSRSSQVFINLAIPFEGLAQVASTSGPTQSARNSISLQKDNDGNAKLQNNKR